MMNYSMLILLLIVLVQLVQCHGQVLVSQCTESQFRCNDGTCVALEYKCDGTVHCPDKSDEDFVICRKQVCQDGQFQCVYGACINRTLTCNGVKDCEDNSDEFLLECRHQTTYPLCTAEIAKQVLCFFSIKCPSAKKRDDYLKQCEKNERTCKDGSQIELKQKCDGKVHCKDGSDESLEMCSTNRCFVQFEFRCKNGACVDASAKCNGISDCADSSDELEDLCHINNKGLCVLPEFPKNGFYNVEKLPYTHPGQAFEEVNLNYSCHSGYELKGQKHPYCTRGYWSHDVPQCVSQCKLAKHPSVEYLCLPNNSSTQEIKECADLVEEGTAVRPKCRQPGYQYKGMLVNMHCQNGEWDDIIVCTPINEGQCTLPPFPKNGYYTVGDSPNAYPGQVLETVHLNYTCHSGYKLVGRRSPYCSKGWWSEEAPQCIAQCLLNKHPSVQYLCLPKNSNSSYGAQECDEFVEDGTVVKSTCRENYYYSGVQVNMHCTDGVWDIVNVCSPQCGLVTASGEQMILGGTSAKRGELPWHAGIYKTTFNPYKQICGGSLISRSVVISAAHCFWTEFEKQQPASNYAVAVGKLYRPWNNPRDEDAQKSNVKEIKIPTRFLGAASNFQDDIAVLIMETPFEFRAYVRPVCIDFDPMFSRRQLHVGAVGKVAGWGLTEEDGVEARVLQVVELPYVDIETCISASPPDFFQFITSDKICAGVINELDLILTYHCCERSMEVTKQVLDLYYTLRSADSFAVFFRDRRLDKRLQFTLDTVLLAPLSMLTVYGYRAVYLRLLDSDCRNFFLHDATRAFFMVLDLWQYEEGTWPGFVIIIDMDQSTIGHIKKLEIMIIKKILYFVQECMLIKLKEVHFRNAPSFMDKLMMLLRPFLKKELLDIIYIHNVGSDSIYKYVPKDAFPLEDGGTYKSRNEIKELTIQRFQASTGFFEIDNKKRVEESRRPGKPPAALDEFGIQGIQGSFKKLELD